MRSRVDLSLLPPAYWARLDATVGERLADMDAAGIDVQVLSVVLPMPQMLPAETAVPRRLAGGRPRLPAPAPGPASLVTTARLLLARPALRPTRDCQVCVRLQSEYRAAAKDRRCCSSQAHR
jgi:hypothetical protein